MREYLPIGLLAILALGMPPGPGPFRSALRSPASLPVSDSNPSGGVPASFIPKAVSIAVPGYSSGSNKALLLLDDAKAADARLVLGERARSEINVIYHELDEGDEAGKIALAEMRRHARSGKTVRLILDHKIAKVSLSTVHELESAGVQIKYFHPYLTSSAHKADYAAYADNMVSLESSNRLWERGPIRRLRHLLASQTYRPGTLRERPLVSFNNKLTHEKLISIDGGSAAISGGRNIRNAYYTDRRNMGLRFIDSDVYVEGPAARDSHSIFMGLWESNEVEDPPRHVLDWMVANRRIDPERGRSLDRFERVIDRMRSSRHISATVLDGAVPVASARFLSESHPRKGKGRGISHDILGLIRSAEKEIVIQNAYVVPTDELYKALAEARGRGVRIQLHTTAPQGNDVHQIAAVYRLDRDKLVRMGVELWELDSLEEFPRKLRLDAADVKETKQGVAVRNRHDRVKAYRSVHAKTISVDGKHLAVTTYNLDPRSQNLNREMGFLFESEELAQEFNQHIARLRASSGWSQVTDASLPSWRPFTRDNLVRKSRSALQECLWGRLRSFL